MTPLTYHLDVSSSSPPPPSARVMPPSRRRLQSRRLLPLPRHRLRSALPSLLSTDAIADGQARGVAQAPERADGETLATEVPAGSKTCCYSPGCKAPLEPVARAFLFLPPAVTRRVGSRSYCSIRDPPSAFFRGRGGAHHHTTRYIKPSYLPSTRTKIAGYSSTLKDVKSASSQTSARALPLQDPLRLCVPQVFQQGFLWICEQATTLTNTSQHRHRSLDQDEDFFCNDGFAGYPRRGSCAE